MHNIFGDLWVCFFVFYLSGVGLGLGVLLHYIKEDWVYNWFGMYVALIWAQIHTYTLKTKNINNVNNRFENVGKSDN